MWLHNLEKRWYIEKAYGRRLEMVGDCLESPFPHILVHTLMEANLMDKVMSTYLGGLITVISDIGGSTMFGPTAHLMRRGCHYILMILINIAKETQ